MFPSDTVNTRPKGLAEANRFLKAIGATRKLARDPHGYYYWLDMDGGLAGLVPSTGKHPKSVYVCYISDLTYFDIRETYESEFGELPLTK